MKYVSKIIIFFLALLISTDGYSQARKNRPEIKFENQSEVLNKATGWSYNSIFGEWLGNENLISNDKNIREQSRVSQNFIEMQFKTVSINNEKYYVLIVQKWRGAYMYPEIYEDWFRWVEVFGYIFSEEQYDSIWNIGTVGSVIKLVTEKWTSVRSEHADDLLDLVQTNLLSGYTFGKCVFPIMKAEVENEEFLRFYIPECPSYYSDVDSFINFDEEYFEVTPTEFEKLKITD